jgi:hypothetical protein
MTRDQEPQDNAAEEANGQELSTFDSATSWEGYTLEVLQALVDD